MLVINKFYDTEHICRCYCSLPSRSKCPRKHLIIEKIRNCFDNYEEEVEKFAKYREMIKNEQSKFIDDIKTIFQVSQ